ncbi:D-aminoacyl-tRNA deacylase-like [Ruditapes philippinarum]|uniref:D-aminoacyl-tRNA deacylase-like n=1 Tax=Ruditapes philippinarum TaxID=129788 RepID=UPI00295B407B|nr:D-aminoacyl-tRNA deacylase-like [Ruditapes philippinarum]
MKAIVQRVVKASVTVDGKTVSSIKNGLCVLVGIDRKDAPKEAEWLAKKILNLRLFDGENDKRWDKNVMEMNYEVLCVSQFTLCLQMKGNKPDFHNAMAPEQSEQFYNDFLQMMGKNYSKDKIKDGIFGAMMVVHIDNDGPVTIPLETPDNIPEPKVRKWQTNQKGPKKKDDVPLVTTTNLKSEDCVTSFSETERAIQADKKQGDCDTKVDDVAGLMDGFTIDSGGGD